MTTPAYRYTADLANQPADAAGRRWYVKEWHDAVAQALDLRAELLQQALVRSGGLVVAPTLALDAGVATITGPAVGLTLDGLAPVAADRAGAGVALDLATLGAAFADGTHAIVLRATAQASSVAFTTPEVVTRDPQGNITGQTEAQAVVYAPRTILGALALIEGTTLDGGDVLVATVDLASSVWSNLTAAGTPPILRAADADVQTYDDTMTVGADQAGAVVRMTDDGLVRLPTGQRPGLRLKVLNDSAAAAVVLDPTGGATLATIGSRVQVAPYGAVTVLHVGGDAWRAWGDLIGGAGSGSGS